MNYFIASVIRAEPEVASVAYLAQLHFCKLSLGGCENPRNRSVVKDSKTSWWRKDCWGQGIRRLTVAKRIALGS